MVLYGHDFAEDRTLLPSHGMCQLSDARVEGGKLQEIFQDLCWIFQGARMLICLGESIGRGDGGVPKPRLGRIGQRKSALTVALQRLNIRPEFLDERQAEENG